MRPYHSQESIIATKRSASKRPILIVVVLAVAILASVLVSIAIRNHGLSVSSISSLFSPQQQTQEPLLGAKNTSGDKRLPIEKAVYKKLAELECKSADIKTRVSKDKSTIEILASVPRGKPFEAVLFDLSLAAKGTSYAVSDCIVDEKKQSAMLTLQSRAKNSPLVTVSVLGNERYFSSTAKMAIVVENLEDTSYQLAVSILSFSDPISAALVPGSKKASLIAQLADQQQKEIIIRLPLEPSAQIPPAFVQTTIMVHYSKEAILSLIANSTREVPNFTGFTNIWGSRACEDTRVMSIVIGSIAKQHGYFLENRTTKNSVVPAVAQELSCPYTHVNARIEKKTSQEIISELKRLGVSAQACGSMIVTAPASKPFLDGLTTCKAWFRQNGIKLAFVSEIVKQPENHISK